MEKALTIKAWIIVVCIVFIIAIPFLPPIINHSVNNVALNIFSTQLFNGTLPENTEMVEKYKVCGKLNGNGNGMDFFAGITIRTDKSMEELEEYFGTKVYRGAYPSQPYEVEIDITKFEDGKFRTKFLREGEIPIDNSLYDDGEDYYLVAICDGDYGALFDFRGN